MKHLNGKQKNKSSQKRKKTSQKPGVSNSGKSYQITYKNLRSRCIVGNEASIIRHKMRNYQVKNMQFTPKKSTLNSFPPGVSNSGKSYQIIYKNLRSRCIVGNEASIIRHKMRNYQVKNMQFTPKKSTLNSFPPGVSNSGKSYQIIYKNLRSRCIVGNEASIIRHKMRNYQVKNMQFTPKKSTLNSFPPGFSNSGKSYQIIHKNLRSRCIGENEASIITHKMRSYQVENEVPLMRSHQIEKLQHVNTKTLNFHPELKSTKHYTGLNTSKNKAVICSVYNGIPEIYVDDPVGNQDRGSLSVDFFTYRTSNEDNFSSSVVGLKLRHSDTDFQVLANDKNIELHKSESQNSAQENKYFILHQNSELVSFECLTSQGLYIGVEEDQLKLMEKKEDDEAFMFQLLTE